MAEMSTCRGRLSSHEGAGTAEIMVSKRGCISGERSSGSRPETPSRAEA